MPEYNENIPQEKVASKSGPQPGEPYNYGLVLDTIQVPRVVYRDRRLSPGARLMWGAIRRLGFKTGQCFASDARIADELCVNERQVRRYSEQLIKAGLMRCTLSPGKQTCRELLWHERFVASESEGEDRANGQRGTKGVNKDATPDATPRTDMSGHPGQICPDPPDRNVRPILSGVLEASLKEPLPLTPSPEIGISGNPENGGSGKGESDEKARGPMASGRPRLGVRKPTVRQSRPPGRRPPVKPPTRPDERPAPDALKKTLSFWWNREMMSEPPYATLEAIAKILHTRRVDDTSYILAVQAEIKHLQGAATETAWLKLALEWGNKKGES